MKLHRILAVAVIAGLREILLHQQQADFTVSFLLQSNKKWGARDRNFIAENIYQIVRYKRLYEFCCREDIKNESSLWRLLGAKLLLENEVLPEWPEFAELNAEEIRLRTQEAKMLRVIRESIPDWMDELGEEQLGARWDAEISALNTQAKFCLRVNTLRSTKEAVKNLLTEENIPFSEIEEAPDALVIETRKNLRKHPAFRAGSFEVQDVSSQLVAPMLEVEPGMHVIDGCAGAGGKTLHLSCLMKNQGEILAIDVNERKLEELEIRARRAGCNNIKTLAAEKLSPQLRARLTVYADRILLDVPCSGLGILRRKPDAKWSLSLKFIEELKKSQASIMDLYAPMLKPGGILVYSTCSILPGENEWQVKNFLERNKDVFELLTVKKISPAKTGLDGFYMAKMRKTGIFSIFKPNSK